MTDLHARLADLITRSKRSQREISVASGLSPGTINDIMKNPDRSPSVNNIRAIAKTLGVSAAWLIDGNKGNEAAGFSESPVSPWIFPAPSGQRPDLKPAREKLARTLAPDARSPSTFRLNQAVSGFNLEKGDVLVVDLKLPAKAGDLVLATVVDLSSGAGTTVLKRNLPPYLIGADSSRPEDTLVVDGARTVIMGPIVASFRAPQLVD